MPAIAELTEPLGDGHVSLRLAAERDIPEILIAYQDDPRLHLSLGQERPPSGAELGAQAERAQAAREAGTRVVLAILPAGSDDCAGQLYAECFDWDNARAELGIWLAPQARGQGLAGRALRLATGWLLRDCGLERLAILTHPENGPMLGAGAAAGFATEGVLRGYRRERGGRVDLTVMSLVAGDLAR